MIMHETVIRSHLRQQGSSWLPSCQKKRRSKNSRGRNNEQFEVILWSCVRIHLYARYDLPWTQADRKQCYCGHAGMTYHVPACALCNVARCEFCHLEKFKVGWKDQELALYTWPQNAALQEDAALFGVTTAEPDLHHPPELRDVTTTVTCTTLEPDPTQDQAGFQDERPCAATPEHVTPQSLKEHSLHTQSNTLTSPTITPRLGFSFSSLSLNHVDTIGLASDPSPLASSIPEQSPDWPSHHTHEKGIVDRFIAAFNSWRARGSNSLSGSSSPSDAVLPNNSQSNQSRASKQSRKRTSDQSNPSKQGGAKRAKTSSDEVRQANEEDKRLFACPFWKKDPIKHRDCFKGVRRIRDVKQHLRRSHQQPVFCRRCGMEFGDQEAALSEHLRAAEPCEVRDFQHPEGITSVHQKALKQYSPRGEDKAAQWYVIWDYLFPGGPNGKPPPPRPSSPYVDEDLSEDMSSFCEFTHREGWRALANDPDLSYVALSVDEEVLQRCFDRIYENWLAKRSTSSQQSGEESPITMSDSSTPDESAPTSDTTSIDYSLLDDSVMTLTDYSADLEFGNNFLGPQIDAPFNDFVAMPSADNTTVHAFPSIPLLTSEYEIEHATQVATLDPTLISH